jgi:hypothetical protein
LELAQHPDRAHPRTSMFVLATMAAASLTGPVKVRNMSPDGALIEGATLPGVGDHLSLQRGELKATGQIVWQDGGKAGVRFRQQLVEQTVYELKNASVAPTLTAPAAARAPLPSSAIERVDLLEAADALDTLADALAGDNEVVLNHSTTLQVLDVAAQLLRRCAVAGRS